MGFATRIEHLRPEGAYVVLAQARALEAQGREIIHLEIGQPDFDTYPHISLAGVQGIIVTTKEETRNAFDQATQTDDVGILLITERVAQMIREKVDKWIIGGGQPLVVEIPDSQGPLEERRTPHKFVKSAIGVKF